MQYRDLFSRKWVGILAVVVYTIFNIKIIASITSQQYWWLATLNSGNSGAAAIPAVILGLFLNIAVILYFLKNPSQN